MLIKNIIRRMLAVFLTGNSQIAFILFVLTGLVCARIWFAAPVSDFTAGNLKLEALPNYEGIIVYSSNDTKLLLKQGQLYLTVPQKKPALLAEDVSNLYYDRGKLWVLAPDQVLFLDMQADDILSVYASVPDLADARLVGIGSYGLDLYQNGQVLVQIDNSWDQFPFMFNGTKSRKYVETEWRQGVLFYRDNGWVIYRHHLASQSYTLPLNMGALTAAELSPDKSKVIFAIANGNRTEVWMSKTDGSKAWPMYSGEMYFSSLDVLWSHKSQQVVFSLLGFSSDAGMDDTFTAVTIIEQAGRTVELFYHHGPTVEAMIPSAWDEDGNSVFFFSLSQELPVPLVYSVK